MPNAPVVALVGPRTIKTKSGRKAVVRRELSKPTKAAIKKIVAGTMETKFNSAGSNNINFNSAIASTSEIYNCIPGIQQGTDSFNRVGGTVKPTRLECNWWISHQDVARSGNMVVSLFVLRHKTYRSFASVVAGANMNELLTRGDQGYIGFQGYVQQCSLPVNSEQFTVVKRYNIPIEKNVGQLQDDVTDGNAPNTGRVWKHIKAVFKLPTLKYDEGAGVADPNNQALFWCLGYAHPDGTAPNTLYQDIQVSTAMNLYYKDA
jgi:hypothetical protein